MEDQTKEFNLSDEHIRQVADKGRDFLPFIPLIRQENGTAEIFYHGTLSSFEDFYPLSHFGTRKAALDAMKSKAYDEAEANEDYFSPEKVFSYMSRKGKIIPTVLNIQKPLEIIDLHNHTVNAYKQMVINILERENYSQLLLRTVPLLRTFAIAGVMLDMKAPTMPPEFDMIFHDPYQMNNKEIQEEILSERLYAFSPNERLNQNQLVLQRMIRFFERRGFSGFKYINRIEDKGQYSYIPFRAEQVIRLDRELPRKAEYRPDLSVSSYERAALDRCCARELNADENKERILFQDKILEGIPKEKIKKSNDLKEVMTKRFPNWKNAALEG